MESGGLGECVSLSVSFSHQRAGSSILASLSEAGGNELRKVASKHLPPRSPLFATRHVKRTHAPSMARAAPCQPGSEFPPSLSLTNTWLSFWISRTAPNPSCNSTLELAKTDSGMRPSPALRFDDPPWLQDLGNKIIRLRALSVFWRVYRRIPSCASFPVTSRVGGVSAPEPRLFS